MHESGYVLKRRFTKFSEISNVTAIAPFKVIQGHRFWYQSKARVRFPISDTNWPPILHGFQGMADYWSNFR